MNETVEHVVTMKPHRANLGRRLEKMMKKVKKILRIAFVVSLIYVALKGFNPLIANDMPTLDLLCMTVIRLIEWAFNTVVGVIFTIFNGTFFQFVSRIVPNFVKIFSDLISGLTGIY